MINELFLNAAVNIRRTYLNVSTNIGGYKKRVEMTYEKLNDTVKEIEKIQTNMNDKNKRKSMTNEGVLKDLLRILDDVEKEGKALQNYIDPLNDEIERLSIEEKELYRNIVKKHPELTEQQIVECVRQRLIKENLI